MDTISPTRLKIIIEAQNKANKAFAEVQKDMERLHKKAVVTGGALSGEFKKMSTKVQDFGSRLKSLEGTFQSMRNWGAIGFAGMTFGMSQAIKTSVSFESAFAGVRKTIEATEQQFNALDTSFQKMTERMPIAYEELSRIAELGGQLGVGVKDIEKFTETVAKIAETTNLTAESASMSFAQIANIMGTPIDQLDKMASVVVDLGNNFATT
jgi:hypothetical protein